MKQFLSFILVLCLLLVPMVAMTSCGGGNDGNSESGSSEESNSETKPIENVADVTKLDMEQITADPYGSMLVAAQNAGILFFADDAGLFGTVSDTMKKGSVAMSFAHRTLMGDIKKIDETIYIDNDAREYVSLSQILMNNRLLSAYLFFDREGLSFKSNAFLGSDKTLEIDLGDFAQAFENSAAAEMSGLSAEMISVISNGSVLFTECYRALFEENSDEAKVLLEEIGEIFSEEIKQTDAGILLSYYVDNEALAALIECLAAHFEGAEESSALIVEKATAFLESYSAEMRMEFMIDPETSAMKSVVLQGILDTAERHSAQAYFSWRTHGDQMLLSGSFTLDDQKYSADVSLHRQVVSGLTSYTVSLDSTYNGGTTHLLDAKYVYDLGGGVKITANVYGEDDDPMELTLLGQITVSETDATISFSSLQYKNVKVLFDALLTFTPNVPIPEKPAETMDVVQMTEEDWNTVLEELRGSVIGELFFGEKEENGENMKGEVS